MRYGPLPVLVFFYSYDFSTTTRSPIEALDLANEGVVVVTVTYRLNVFGFLCLRVPEVRGNMGLLDQYLSLIWIRENIRYFGGDPYKITLYGHSGGATSVALHMISTRTTGKSIFKISSILGSV